MRELERERRWNEQTEKKKNVGVLYTAKTTV